MDLKLSYKWVKEYVKSELSAEDFARKLSLHGPSIERWHKNDAMDDFVLDIEVTTNRIDSASVIGIAREASAILNTNFLWTKPNPDLTVNKSFPLKASIEDYARCPRFQAIVMDNVTIKESPEWLKQRLEASGINSINNVVDITNYVLLEYGQPMHAFDYSKVEGSEIKVRLAKQGEKITTLVSTQEVELTSDDLVIADATSPLSIAGVVGGSKSGIKSNTKTIILEAANFNAIKTRKTARRHNTLTDASSLFEKDLPAEQTEIAILRAIELVKELAGGEVASELLDVKADLPQPKFIKYPYSLTKRILGLEITKEEIINNLTRLGFECEDAVEYLNVKVPYYRSKDVQLDYDLTEEIARIYGYHKIPSVLPVGQIPQVNTPSIITNEDKVREFLAANGFTELFSYSLISDRYLKVSSINPESAFEISNPLNEDFKYLRTHMASTMLITAESNEALKDNLKLFEISNVYLKKDPKDLPLEESHLSILVNGTNYKHTFYELKGIFELVLKSFGIDTESIEYKNEKVTEPFFTGKSANIYLNNDLLGTLGLVSRNAKSMLGLKKETALLEVNFVKLSQIIDTTVKSYSPIPKYPAVTRDLAFVLNKSIQWKEIQDLVRESAGDLLKSIELFDVFEDKKLGEDKKSIAFHVTLQSLDRTLIEDDVVGVMTRISTEIQNKFKALERVR